MQSRNFLGRYSLTYLLFWSVKRRFFLILSCVFRKMDFDTTDPVQAGDGVRRLWRAGEEYYVYQNEEYKGDVVGGNSASNILDTASRYCSGSGVDVGCGGWPFPGAVGIDNENELNAFNFGPHNNLDFVFSSHCLEHIADWQEALAHWISRLKIGGTLFLYLPHHDMLLWRPESPWVSGPGGHQWSPTFNVLEEFLKTLNTDIIAGEAEMDKHYSFYIVARKKS